MRRYLIIVLILLQIPLLYVVSNSIVTVTVMQLRYQLTRERLLNYELSSRVLEARFRQMLESRDDYSSEIEMNVLESSILNFEEDKTRMELTPFQVAGLIIVNGVRALSFKSFLSLSEDQQKLLMLQYAFYLERNRRYPIAAEKYSSLESELKNGNPEDYGFVLLHNGYSHAMIGKEDVALKKLEAVMEKFPGSHYSTTASLLYNLILEGQKKSKEIETQYNTEQAKGVAYFQTGNYAKAIEKLEKAERLEAPDEYYLSRSYEETGQMKSAVDGYVKLARQNEDQGIAKQANRRLLMIGSFYGGGKEISEFAEKKAEELGDEEIVKEVSEGKEMQLKPVVIEKLKKQQEEKKEAAGTSNQETSEEVDETLGEIQEELASNVEFSTEELVKLEIKKAPVEEKKEEEEQKEEEPSKKPERVIGKSPRLYVEFIDGRKIFSKEVDWVQDEIVLRSGDYNISLPGTMVGKIGMDEDSGDVKNHEIQLRMSGGKVARARLLEKEGDEMILTDSSGKESIIDLKSIKSVRPVVRP